MTSEEVQAIHEDIKAKSDAELALLTEQEQADKVQADLQEIRDSKPGDICHG